MLYEIALYFQGGSHHAILKDVIVSDGHVHATQVGKVDSWSIGDDPIIFIECTPRDYYAAGTFVLVEFKGELNRK